MSCPWAKIEKPEAVNLQDIMSEEVAKDLQIKEEKKYLEQVLGPMEHEEVTKNALEKLEELQDVAGSPEATSDEIIASMLQMEFDKEYDDMLKRTEEKFNGASKVSISFENYRRAPQNFDFISDSEEEEIEDIAERKNWDRFEAMQKEFGVMPPCGYKMHDGQLVTKHDGTISGRKNACKLLNFPPEFHTGDGENFDLKLSNKVFNSLKRYSQNEQSRRHKINDKKEDQATAEFGLDQFTRLILYKLINNEVLEQVNGVISIGKEAVILHADGNTTYEPFPVPKECVLKVFKTTLSEFKQRNTYIKDDRRFKDRIGKQTARKTVHIWAEKEMANLYRVQRAGIPCPSVVTLKTHVLVMTFIGENHRPAPKLKEAILSNADYIIAYEQVKGYMKLLFEKANLIHADLSEYNILWHNDQCYFIDVSQAVEPIHDNAFFFLMRDCNNVTNFFQRKSVPEILTASELFKFVTGVLYENKVELLSLQESVKIKPHTINRGDDENFSDNFQKVWEKISISKNSPKNVVAVKKAIEEDGILAEPPKA